MRITDTVEINPTQRGWEIIKDQDIEPEEGWRGRITDTVEINPMQRGWEIIKDQDIEPEEGWRGLPRFPLWLIMKWFGPHFYIGREKPFLEMTIIEERGRFNTMTVEFRDEQDDSERIYICGMKSPPRVGDNVRIGSCDYVGEVIKVGWDIHHSGEHIAIVVCRSKSNE